MIDSIQALLDTFPEGVVQVQGGTVTAANAVARRYLPRLKEGALLPPCILLPREGGAGAGMFTSGPASYTYSCGAADSGQVLLFRPAPQAALTGRQMEGALRQLRGLLGELLAGYNAQPEGGPAFSKSFHRLFRLVQNMEYLHQAAGEDGPSFRPVTMDLAGLCLHVSRQAGGLLREAGVTLEYQRPDQGTGLLIHGDPRLLQRLLLDLISNAARASNRGSVVLALHRRQGRAVLTLSDSGPALDRQGLAAMFGQGAGEALPLPGQGAGLGLAIVNHILALHGGSILVGLEKAAPRITIQLPAGPLNGRISVSSPICQQDGGLDPVLTALSDILPAFLFGMEGLD